MTLPPTTTLTVDVTPPYPVRIGPGVLAEAAEHLPGRRVALVSDAHVAPLYADAAEARLAAAGRSVLRLVVPPGEGSKSVRVWDDLLRALARDGFGRDDAGSRWSRRPPACWRWRTRRSAARPA